MLDKSGGKMSKDESKYYGGDEGYDQCFKMNGSARKMKSMR
jgi:hypothetical protein